MANFYRYFIRVFSGLFQTKILLSRTTKFSVLVEIAKIVVSGSLSIGYIFWCSFHTVVLNIPQFQVIFIINYYLFRALIFSSTETKWRIKTAFCFGILNTYKYEMNGETFDNFLFRNCVYTDWNSKFLLLAQK